ncbi:MAG: hypothetical protein K8W52_02210 [Deltaproteobacteria bacterium]|nr:hypothetical protein [Deltaproteobacteria bacterium]
MSLGFTASARRLGRASAFAVVGLGVAYAITLAIGLATLPSPDEPITGALFTLLELLILAMMPAIVVLMVAVHAWAPAEMKAWSLSALVFASLLAGVTSSLHFVILTLSHQPAFAGMSLAFAFRWPSVAYALDILAWDVFFALAALCAAPVFRGAGLERRIRWLLIASGALAAAGLSGVATGDMRLRNLGILGYAVLFPIAAALLGALFTRTPERATRDATLMP